MTNCKECIWYREIGWADIPFCDLYDEELGDLEQDCNNFKRLD